MNLNLTPPPQLRGDEKQQLTQLRSYLYQMQQQLNIALEQVTPEALAEQIAAAQAAGAKLPDNTDATLSAAYNKLKSIIIKTADTVRTEMDTLEVELAGAYVAQGTMGSYYEELSSLVQADAAAVVQTYGFESQLTAASDAISNIETYNVNTEQYIKTGLLFYDGDVPRYGVAVGEKITTVVVDGETLLERQGLCATFTSDRLSFWQNEVEVAYISNNKLYINEAHVLSRLFIGSWVIDTSYGLAIKWGGV